MKSKFARPAQEQGFIPAEDILPDEFDWQSGEHQTPDRQDRYRLRWPTENRLQRELFEAWHAVAMQVADGRVRVLAVIWRFINWKTGTFFPTDSTLAECAGGCSTKTISREVARYDALGIVDIERGWRKNSSGQFVRTRVLHPTIPADLKGTVKLPLIDDHMDTSGPYEPSSIDGNHMDTSGPNHMDTSGPFTLESPLKKGAADAA